MTEMIPSNSNWSKIFEIVSKNLAEILVTIDENKCNKPKEIGDRVMIWDGSDNEDVETGKHYFGNDEIFKYPVIIIEKDCINEYFDPHIESKTNRDLVVYSPKYKRKIATCMSCVKLVD